MQWGSIENFLNMGGYGFYVWGSYVVCALAIAVEIVMARGRGRRALDDARAFAARGVGKGA